MIDSFTGAAIHVSTDGDAGPYIVLRLDQLDVVKKALDQSHVLYWVDENAVSLNGKPELVVINLSRDTDAKSVQTILDHLN